MQTREIESELSKVPTSTFHQHMPTRLKTTHRYPYSAILRHQAANIRGPCPERPIGPIPIKNQPKPKFLNIKIKSVFDSY